MLRSYNLHSVRKYILDVLLFSLIIFVSFPSYAKEKVHNRQVETEYKAVKGFIEEIYDHKIKVKGHFYDIERAKIIEVSGNKINKDVLHKGAEVEVHIKLENNEVSEVIYYHGHLPQ